MSYIADREKEFAWSCDAVLPTALGTGARNTSLRAGIGAVAPKTQIRNDGNPGNETWSLI